MNSENGVRVNAALGRDIHPVIADFARRLAEEADGLAVLFYGSNLRTGSLDGVIDFYILTEGEAETGMWPLVSYREWDAADRVMRSKIATMTLAKFHNAASGKSRDTTIWARFVQPCAIVWSKDDSARDRVVDALKHAARTAARVAVAVGPKQGTEAEFWQALFKSTYKAELRVEKPGRENSIIEANQTHFDGLLPTALAAQGIEFVTKGDQIVPELSDEERREILRWWAKRRRLGKLINIARLARATRTFDGAGRYAAWKVERHTGVEVKVTPFREKHPWLSAPSVLWKVWKAKRQG